MKKTVSTGLLLVTLTLSMVACQPIRPIDPNTAQTVASDAPTANSADETANLAVVEGFFMALVENKDAAAVATYLADDFISHTPQVDGKQGMVDFATWQAENEPAAGFVDVFHTVAKDDLVIKYYSYSNDPTKGAELAIVDFFRVADGKIVEYWDVVVPIEEPDPNAAVTAMTAASAPADEAANLAVVEGFFTALVENKDPAAVATYLADDFISHTPQVDGKQGMVDFAAWQAENAPAAGFVDVIHTVAKGDLVIKYYTYANDPTQAAELTIVDFFRVVDGKIVEYWDVVAPIEE